MIESKLVKEVYEKLEDRSDIELTHAFEIKDSGFREDLELIRGESAKGKFFLYHDDGVDMFVFDVEYPDGSYTHWHPWDVDEAVHDIIEFMEPDGEENK